MSFTLTLLDTMGIQEYIFSSNRLQENIGASELVFRATSLWVFKAILDTGISVEEFNIWNPYSLDWDYSERMIEDKINPPLQAEVIHAAGGNTLILFRESVKAIKFVETLTLRLLKEAPGLTVLAQHDTEFDFYTNHLDEKRKELENRMRQHKLSRLPSSPTLGMSVSSICASSGLPAVITLGGKWEIEGKTEPLGLPGEDEITRISSEVAAKRAWRGQANLRLMHVLKEAADEFVFPYDLDKLGRLKGEESYVAVVHADGNRMGEHVKRATAGARDNREWIRALRDFSTRITAASLDALQTVVGLVVQSVKRGDIPCFVDEEKKYLPFRPLVFGGDDVTFVCNGLIGVSLAAAYLEEFHKAAESHGLPGVFASAGISIVKLHYPFSRAYRLSEELASSAKKLTREVDCSALDWHFAQSGLSGSLKVIRNREYTADDCVSSLCLRPLRLEDGVKSWHNFERVLMEFKNDYWAGKHNKVIGLREPLRKGASSVEQYRLDFGLKELPTIPGTDAETSGWKGDICYYFDAVELLDHYVPLK